MMSKPRLREHTNFANDVKVYGPIGEQRVEYGVLHNVETATKSKMSLFDGNFLYDYAGVLTVIGYKVIE